MDSNQSAAPARLPLGRTLRAHVVLILLCTVAGAALLGGAAALLPQEYTATTSVLVRPLQGNPYSPDAQGSDLTNLETEAQIVGSDVIVEQVQQELGDQLPGEINKDQLGITVAPNTQIVRISYTDPSAEVAAAVSQQFGQAYLDYRQSRRQATVDSRKASLDTRVASVNEVLARLRKQGRPEDDPEMRSVGGQLLNLRLQLATLEATETNPGDIIAQGPARRSGIAVPPWLAAAAGGLLGLALGAGLAFLRERSAEPLRTVLDIEHLGVPVLAHRLAAVAEDTSPSDVALMVGAVINRRVPRPVTIAVTHVRSTRTGEEFPEDLAHALAQGSDDVLVIDGTIRPRRPSGHGLSEVLKGRPLSRVVRRDSRGYATIGPGRAPAEAERWYATMRFTGLLHEATDTFGMVLVHGDATDETSGRALVGACDFWIPLVALGGTSREDLERGISWAGTVGTKVLGVVAIDSPLRARAGFSEGPAVA
jgi:capsular polysaccharide biosynthesis protein